MNDSTETPGDTLANASREEIMTALFANMVIQQTNMAMMLLGRVAHPETGEFVQDVEAAKMFIDQLEMIEAKTKGNLTRQEEALLKQGLTALRMAFVEAVEASAGAGVEPGAQPPGLHTPPPSPPRQPEPAPEAKATPAPTPKPSPPAEPPPAAEPAPEESRKRFSKKY